MSSSNTLDACFTTVRHSSGPSPSNCFRSCCSSLAAVSFFPGSRELSTREYLGGRVRHKERSSILLTPDLIGVSAARVSLGQLSAFKCLMIRSFILFARLVGLRRSINHSDYACEAAGQLWSQGRTRAR